MAWQFHLELTMSNCVPWVEPRGVSDELRDGDELIGMDILPSSILASLAPILKQRLRDWREAKLHRQSPSTNLGRNLTTVEADITEEDIEPKISN